MNTSNVDTSEITQAINQQDYELGLKELAKALATILAKQIAREHFALAESGVKLRPMDDYNEDVEDRKAIKRAKHEECFPVEVVDALISGNSPVRVFRQYRNIKVDRLSAAAGISTSYLSKIENRKSTPSAAVYLKLASALDVDIEDLY